MNDLTGWILGIAAALIVLAISGAIAWFAKVVSGKADQTDLKQAIKDRDEQIALAVKNCDVEIKRAHGRIDAALVALASAVTKTDLMKDLSHASDRAGDKSERVDRDIAELKGDIKALLSTMSDVVKELDNIPARVASLERDRGREE